LNLLEDVIEGAWHDTLLYAVVWNTSNGESLSSTCLTVRKDGSIVALDDIFTYWIRRLSENFFLLGVPIVDRIECEDFWDTFASLLHENFTCVLEHLDSAKEKKKTTVS